MASARLHFVFELRYKSTVKSWRLALLVFAALASVGLTAQAPTPSEADALQQQGHLAEAENAWRSIARQNPHNGAALASLGVVLSKQQKYSEASQAYKKALAINPKLPGIELNLGLAEFKQGHFQSAIKPFSKALGADPNGHRGEFLQLVGAAEEIDRGAQRR